MNRRPGVHTTCWMLIRDAADGEASSRDLFASRYIGVVRAFFASRWQGTARIGDLEDAVQEVFYECLKEGGVLDRASVQRPDSFRAFLLGVSRKIALRCERRAGQRPGTTREISSEDVESAEASLSRVFDRAWAESIFRQAGELLSERAKGAGDDARRRVEILELRTRESLPIREIAARWRAEPARVHKEYARARSEFKAALEDVIVFHHPGISAAGVHEKCHELIAMLQT